MTKRSGSADEEGSGWLSPSPFDSHERACKRVCNDDVDVEHASAENYTPMLVNDADEPSNHVSQNPNPNNAGESQQTASIKRSKLRIPAWAAQENSEYFAALTTMNVRSTDSDISADCKNNNGCSSLKVDDVVENSPFLDRTEIIPPERIIKVTEDTSLVLVPRIKLNFVLGCTKGSISRLLVESTVKPTVTSFFRHPRLFPNKPLMIPESDIHFRYVAEPRWMDEDNMFVVVEGTLFVRNSKLQDKKALLFGRNFLLHNMSSFQYKYWDDSYKLRLSLPPEEDADQMMASISKLQNDDTGPSQEPPTIMMRGLRFQWFAGEPNSSEPSKQLLLYFFKNFGSIRDLDVVEDGVIIQFENCYKALQLLCSCSLQKVGSNEMVDYTIMWKDQDICFDVSKEASSVPKCIRFHRALNGRMFVSPPRNEVLKQKAKALECHVSKLEDELKASIGALKTYVREFVEELNHLPA